MSNHCIRWKCSTSQKGNPDRVPSPEPPDLPNVVPGRVQMHVEDKFSTVLPGQNSDGVSNTEIDGSGVDYVSGVRRFDDAEDKDEIVQSIVNNVVSDAEWAVIESHVCTHDEENPSPCDGWKIEKELGDVPVELN